MNQSCVQCRCAASLAADVTGYSQLKGEYKQGAVAALKAHFAKLIEQRIPDYQDWVV